MKKTSPPPFAWVRKIAEFIPEAFEIPLFGNAPPFNWKELSSLLAARFDTKEFSIRLADQTWIASKEVKKKLGAKFFAAELFLNPLKTPFYFTLSKADRNKLVGWMMEGTTKSQVSEPLKEGFCRFLLLEALDASAAIEPLSLFTLSLGEEAKIPNENVFCIDIELIFAKGSCWSTLILPASFRTEWVEHFSMQESEYTSNAFSQATELILGLECGSIAFTQTLWEQVEPGDFLLLDRSSYDPSTRTGLAIMKIGLTPLFEVKITTNKLEFIDYAVTHEENMEQDSSDSESLTPAEEESASIKDIPINVCVELARLRITLDRLMHLNPGNTIELPIHPDQGVTLTVNGKKVGRAELLFLGESLGIRVLELG